MNGLDIVWVIVSPCPSHPFRFYVIRHNVAVVREFLVTDGTFSVLLGNLAVQQRAHFCGRAEFAISSGVVRIFNAPHAGVHTFLFARLLAATAEARAMDWTVFVSAEFHRQAPVRLRRNQADRRKTLGGRRGVIPESGLLIRAAPTLEPSTAGALRRDPASKQGHELPRGQIAEPAVE